MNQICLVVPVLPGRTSDVRDFMRELETGRNADCRCIRCRAVSLLEMTGWMPGRSQVLPAPALRACGRPVMLAPGTGSAS